MRMRYILLIAFLATVFVTGMTISAAAQGRPDCRMHNQGKGRGHNGPYCVYSELTQEQQGKIDELRTGMQKECLNLRNQVREKSAHLSTISTVDQPDMAAINKTIDEMYALKAEIAKKKAAFRQDARKILSPEQWLQFGTRLLEDSPGISRPVAGHHGPMTGMGCHGNGCCKGHGPHGPGMNNCHRMDNGHGKSGETVPDKKDTPVKENKE